jgi:hypothetical protein
MKKLLYIPLLFMIFCAKAQQPRIESQPVWFLKWLKVSDSMRVKIIFQGANDTLATQAYARGFAGGSLTPGVGITISGSTVSIDTLHYRKQDSMYIVTDSTGIFKINGRSYPFKMRGGVWAFNHRLGDVLPAKNDYAAFYPKLDSTYENPSFISHLSWSKILSTPNTLATYGILDGVRNAGGLAVLQADAYSNRPAPGGQSSIFLAIDSSILYYNNGTTWQAVSNPNGGGSDTLINPSYGLLTTIAGKTKTIKVDTTTLKQVFGSGSPGVVQLFTKWPGLSINGTDTVSADTTVLMRWSDTLLRVASRTYVNSRGFITSESDPIAQAKQVSIIGTASAGINVTGAAQTIGSNPAFTLKADTALLSTHFYVNSRGFISAEVDPVAQADTINISGPASAGILIAETAKQQLGASPTWTVKADTALLSTHNYVNTRGFISAETDPVANARTINISGPALAGILVTGLSSQALSTNPTYVFKADTALLETRSDVLTYLRMVDTRTTNPLAIPSGAGTRFMWIPSLGALRAGAVTGSNWDIANIGARSTAVGVDNLAAATGSSAFGDSNTISAASTYSVAMGSKNNIPGSLQGIALGTGNTVVGGSAIALGTNGRALGAASFVAGLNSSAVGNYSSVIGSALTAKYDYQHFVGKNNDSTNALIAFGVGWGGTPSTRKNIFIVDTSGNAIAAGVPILSDSSNQLVPSKWVKQLLISYVPVTYVNPILNFITDLGGNPDGVTANDSAFARLSRLNNVTVVFPKGTYRQTKILGFTGTTNVNLIGLAGDSSRIVADMGVKTNLFIGRNSRNMLVSGIYWGQKDTSTSKTKQNAVVLIQSDTTFTSPNRDSTALSENIYLVNNWFVGNGANSMCNGVFIVSHRSGWGATVRNVVIRGNKVLNMGASGIQVLGEYDKRWMYDISSDHNFISHMGLVDTTLGFGVSNSGLGTNMYIGYNHFRDITMIGAEQTMTSYSTTENNVFDSCFRNTQTTPYVFNAAGFATQAGNRAINNLVMDSIPAFPYILNQSDFQSAHNRVYAYSKAGAVVSSLLIDSVRNSKFTEDYLFGTMTPRPTVYVRKGSSGVTFNACTILGVTTQNQLVLVTDTTSIGNLFTGCTFGGNLSDATLINYQNGANAIVRDAFSLRSGVNGYTAGIPVTNAPSSFIVKNSAGQQSEFPFGPLGVSRIAPIDSLSRVAAGLQIVGTTLVNQTASSTLPGAESAAHWRETDSLIQRLLKSTINLGHPGAGKWSGYSSLIGDSLYLKNFNVSSDLTLTSPADSSLLFGVNFTTVAGVTTAQTLTNKTLTTPIINVGSDASGDMYYRNSGGLFTRIPAGTARQGLRMIAGVPTWVDSSAGGGGSQNLSQSLTALADTLKISGGTGTTILGATHSQAGLVTAPLQTRLDSIINVAHSGHGRFILRAPYTMDSLIDRGLGFTGTNGIGVSYTGNNDSLSWNIAFNLFTTAGDQMIGGASGVPTRVPIGSNGQIWTVVSGAPAWAAAPAGSVTQVTAPSGLPTLFTTSVATNTTTPVISFTAANAPAHSFLGNFTGSTGAYSFGNPVLASADFANQGAVGWVLHGNTSGNPSWSPVSMVTDVTGLLQATQFPALTGAITTTPGSLVTTLGSGVVGTGNIAAGAVLLSTQVGGTLPSTNGGTQVNNGGRTISVAGNFATAGAFPLTLTTTASTNVTLPTSGTLLTTNGSGASLTNIPLSATGTANMVLVNGTTGSAQTGALTFTLPQNIGVGNAPTFTGMNLTGLGGGLGTDNLVTILGGTLRSADPILLLSRVLTASLSQPSLSNSTNVSAVSFNPATTKWQRSGYPGGGSQVTVSGIIGITPTGAGQVIFDLTIPFAPVTNPASDDFLTGVGTGDYGGTYLPVKVYGDHTNIKANFQCTAPGNAQNINITYQYTYIAN